MSTCAQQIAPDLEIHVPISPTPTFFTMLHYLAASLRLNGGPLKDSRIVVMVGADQEPQDLHERVYWSRLYPIEWCWLSRQLFQEHGYQATAIERFRLPFRARAVMMVDADVLVVAPFADLLADVIESPAFAGVIAHVSPFPGAPGASGSEWWAKLFAEAGLGTPLLSCEHTGWETMCQDQEFRYCPPYFNLGMLLAPCDMMKAIGAIVYSEMENVTRVLDTYFRCQIAVALALQRLRLPVRLADMRYNFPNDYQITSRFGAQLADVRLFHYLRIGPVDKFRDFQSAHHVAELLERKDLSGVNAELQRHLRRVHEQVMIDG